LCVACWALCVLCRNVKRNPHQAAVRDEYMIPVDRVAAMVYHYYSKVGNCTRGSHAQLASLTCFIASVQPALL
jgi:hypothetical protein